MRENDAIKMIAFISSIIQETEDRVRGEMREKIEKTVKKYISKDEQIFHTKHEMSLLWNDIQSFIS